MDLQNGGAGGLAAITALVKQGYNNGTWTGAGITSSTAANDSTHLTAVGVVLNSGYIVTLDGLPVAADDVLAKYTYYGDANLDGMVDGSDYTRIDFAYLADQSNPTAMTGWYNGDFNYDGLIDGSDYSLIDNAFNTQGAVQAATIAGPSVEATDQIAGTASVPEPASLALLAIAATGALGQRRNRH